MASDSLYKGDLLANVAGLPQEFWVKYPELNNRLIEIAHEIVILPETLNGELVPAHASFSYK